MNIVKRDELESGYIFLNRFSGPDKSKHPDWSDTQIYASEALYLIRKMVKRDAVDIGCCSNLIHYMITAFDNSDYTHAALFFNEEMDPTSDPKSPCICEAGPKGIYSRKLVTDPSWETDVVELLALRDLQLTPIADNVRTALGKDIQYGYKTAMLMMAICVLRRWRQMSDSDVDFLQFILREIGLGNLANNFPAISSLLILAFEALVVYEWTDDQMMCSQFVSNMFNSLSDKRYHIEFTERSMGKPTDSMATQSADENLDVVKSLQELENELAGGMQTTKNTDANLLEKVLKDAMTPGDILASLSTSLVGRLEKGIG